MTPLSPEKITELESVLRLNRAAVLTAIHEHLHRSGRADTSAITGNLQEIDDAALENLLTDTDITILRHELAELGDIDDALLRINAGTYGICTACGEAIPSARMEAQPATQHCLACRKEFEKRHGIAQAATL